MTTLWSYEDLDVAATTLRARLKEIVTRIGRTGTTNPHVLWRDERQEFVASGTVVKLHMHGSRIHGTPEQIETYDPDTEVIKVDIYESRSVTLQILIETFDQDATAWELADKMRTRFYRPGIIDGLREVNASIVRVEDAQILPRSYDNRVWSVCAFDVRLSVAKLDLQGDWDDELVGSEVTDAPTFIETVSFKAPIEPSPADAIASEYAVIPPPT